MDETRQYGTCFYIQQVKSPSIMRSEHAHQLASPRLASQLAAVPLQRRREEEQVDTLDFGGRSGRFSIGATSIAGSEDM